MFFSKYSVKFDKALPPKPIVIDTDAGFDDIIAIAIILSHPELYEVKGIVVSGTGIAERNDAFKSMKALCQFFNRSDIKVFSGAQEAISPMGVPVPEWIRTANTGIFDTTNIAGPNEEEQDAQDFLQQAFSEPCELLALGPLTNVGLLLQQHPECAANIARAYIMGGAADSSGNVEDVWPGLERYAGEFNVVRDIAAQQIVHKHVSSILLLDLCVTKKFPIAEDYLERLEAIDETDRTPLQALCTLALNRMHEPLSKGFLQWWDVVLAAAMVHPNAVKAVEQCRISVDSETGQTKKVSDGSGTIVTVVTEIDAELVNDLITPNKTISPRYH